MTLTRQKLAIYQKYRGDVDMLARAGSRKEQEEMADEDWSEMLSLLQQLQNLERGQLSEEFARRVLLRLQEVAPDPAFQMELRAYALTGV
jgi:hypothetical protein